MATYNYSDRKIKRKLIVVEALIILQQHLSLTFWYDLLKRIQIIVSKAIDLISDE